MLLAENEDPGSGGGAPVAERLLSVMEVVLMEANSEPLEHGKVSERKAALFQLVVSKRLNSMKAIVLFTLWWR